MPWKNSWFQLAVISAVFSAGILLFDMKGTHPNSGPSPTPAPVTTTGSGSGILSSLLSIFKSAPTPAQLAEAQQDYASGDTALNSQSYDTAIQDFNQAVQINPKYTDAINDRGLAYDDKGNHDQAIQDYTQAIQVDPTYKTAYNNRGYAYQEEKNYSAALTDYNKAIDLDPNYALAYENRGYTNFYNGSDSQALQDFTRAFQINPNYAYCYMMAAWILATSGHDELRDGKKAVEYANKAGEINGWKDSSMNSTLAAACAEAGDYDNAVKWISEFLKSSGIDPQSLSDAQAQLASYRAGKPWHRSL